MKRVIISILVFTVLLALLLAPAREVTAGQKKKTAEIKEYYDLLILGIDRRPYQKTGRSDVMMIVHCEPGRITMFSIPRDTLTYVKRGRKDKLNHAFAYGQVRLSKSAIEKFLKFKVDNYIVVDFETFLTTVDVVKKITDDGRLIGAENFLASGENLLKWLRFRSLPKGDRRRCQRHQLFMKRVFEYTQDIFIERKMLFAHCMKTALKIVESDLTYEHSEELFGKFKDIDLDENLERFVLPGYGSSRYKANPNQTARSYERSHMPNFNSVVAAEGLEGEEAAARKKQLVGKWRRSHALISYYVPKYNWPLVTYVKWFRKNNVVINYKEVDTLRK